MGPNYRRPARSNASQAARWTACHGVGSHSVPMGTHRAVLHPRRVEGGPPPALVVLSELEIVALTPRCWKKATAKSPRTP
jgi:hypothetical protein